MQDFGLGIKLVPAQLPALHRAVVEKEMDLVRAHHGVENEDQLNEIMVKKAVE